MSRKLVTALWLSVVALALFAALPLTAQDGTVWSAQYYNTAFLTGDVVLQRQENALAFNWGAGSPAAEIHSDNFSARFGADVFLPAGTYRFWALADDGVRIVVDFVSWSPVVDTWDRNSANQIVSGDVTLGAGTHHIQVDYRELSGDARLFVSWANLASNPSGPNFPAVPPPQVPVGSGSWTAQYYANTGLSGNPAAVIAETNIDHNWGNGAPFPSVPADNFSVRWTGVQNLAAGVYQFRVRADDGVRVFVNGQRLIDEWHGATGTIYTADIYLPVGQHNVMVEYYEAGGNAFIDLDILLSGSAPAPPPPNLPGPSIGGLPGSWLATYYNNPSLQGDPTAILSENSPNHNWGTGSPVASVVPDNFSARWTSAQTLPGGTYQMQVRADDGVRVYIDGILYIDEWHLAQAATYSRTVNLGAGTHNFTIEYYEAGGVAYLDFAFGAAGTTPPTQSPGAASGTIQVGSYRLNVRSEPNTSSAIITKINPGEIYAALGCNADRSWWQIEVAGARGWVFASFVNAAGANCHSATAPGGGIVSPTGYVVTASSNVNIRSQPTTAGALLGTLRAGESAPVVGRNSNNTWWQIDRNGLIGWVSGGFARLQSGADVNQIPVRG